MWRKLLLLTVLAVVGAVVFVLTLPNSPASAFGTYLSAFNAKYGTTGTALDTCATCHNPDFTRNPYGAAMQVQAGTIDERLTAVEPLDSDGDGFSNIDEINARTKPGDPTNFPSPTPTATPPGSTVTASATATGIPPTSTPTPIPATPTPTPTPLILTSIWVAEAPTLDGVVDSLWASAPEISVPVAGGVNIGSTTIHARSVYTSDSVYFLLDYADSTESLRRMPWQKQAGGTWSKLSTSATHQENTYYEDKVALAWDINGIADFQQGGCTMLCHAGESPANSGYGSKYTQNAGELADLWHWKSVRTNPVGQVDDQYVNSDRYDAVTAPEAGRHADPKTAGTGYFDNKTGDGTMPAWTSGDQPAPPYWIMDSEKTPFVDTYATGDEVASIVARAFGGDRADVSGRGVYSSGRWYLEIGRPLTTGSALDVQFSDLSASYFFGAAVFDNAQVNHAYQSGATRFVFGPTPVPTATPTATRTSVPTATATSTPAGCIDLDGDGRTSGRDVAIVAKALFAVPGDKHWDPRADVNGDGVVSLTDLLIVIRSMQTCR